MFINSSSFFQVSSSFKNIVYILLFDSDAFFDPTAEYADFYYAPFLFCISLDDEALLSLC
jgi:hypothetical protein